MKVKLAISKLLIPNENLTQKTVSAGIWMTISKISYRTLSLIRTIILARLLAPKDFGLFGIALVSISAITTLSQTGFNEALIQKKEDHLSHLDTAWTIKVLRGLILFIAIFLLAPSIAFFFKEPEVTLLLRILSLSLLIGGLGNQGVIYFLKNLEFHKQFIYEFGATTSELIVSLILAFIMRNAIALAYGYTFSILVSLIISYTIHPYRPKFRCNLNQIKNLSNFGKWISFNNILNFLYLEGSNVYLGKILGLTALGLYQMAYKISSVVTNEFGVILSQVTFSAYSKIQDDVKRLKEAYIKALKISLVIIIPVITIFLYIGPTFVKVFLGDKWSTIIPVMNILIVTGCLGTAGALNNSIFASIGSSKIVAKLQLLRTILLFIFIYPLTKNYGFLGTGISFMLSRILIYPIECYVLYKIIRFDLNDIRQILIAPIFSSTFSLLIVILFGTLLSSIAGSFIFLISISSIYIIIYLCFFYLADIFLNYNVVNIFKKMFSLPIK